MEDIEQYIINKLASFKKQTGKIPDYKVKTEPPDKIRLIFRDSIEKPITFGEWTVITVTPQNFSNMANLFPIVMRDLTKGKP